MANFFIKDFGPHGAHARVAEDDKPARFAVIILKGMFPGRILANPRDGNNYYATREDAESAMAEIIRKDAAGEMI